MSPFPPRALCELIGGPLDGLRIDCRLAEDAPTLVQGVNPDTPFAPAVPYRRVHRLAPTGDGRSVRRRSEPARDRRGRPGAGGSVPGRANVRVGGDNSAEPAAGGCPVRAAATLFFVLAAVFAAGSVRSLVDPPRGPHPPSFRAFHDTALAVIPFVSLGAGLGILRIARERRDRTPT